MKLKIFLSSVFFIFSLLPVISFAQDKVVVIPLLEERIIQCKCTGTLSSGGRWCDQGNGTVLDMTTCLVWLKKADWGGQKPWRINLACESPDDSCHDDAHTLVSTLQSGASGAGLSDGSARGKWRLPTKTELYNLANGTEAVKDNATWFFTGVQNLYWSSTTVATVGSTGEAWHLYMPAGDVTTSDKTNIYYVWPVRSAN